MNIHSVSTLPRLVTPRTSPAVNPPHAHAVSASPSQKNITERVDSPHTTGHAESGNPSTTFQKNVIYGPDTVSASSGDDTLQERKQRIEDYSFRVRMLAEQIPSIHAGQRSVNFQNARLFMEPAGYFSGGLLAAGYDPHEQFTVTFSSYTGMGKPENLSGTSKRTYFAWEIAAGALAHDKVQRGGPINFNFMEIAPNDKSKINDLESLGKTLQNHWENEISKPMRNPSGPLAAISGEADAYAVKGTLQSLRSDTQAFKKLTPEAQKAVTRTLDENGQVIIPNVYGYPMSGHAFIPYTPYDGNYEQRPNQGLMIDIKNGSVREIHGDADFAHWAKDNHSILLKSFNTRDIQGGKDAHWPNAGYVLDTLISGAKAHFPGYHNLLSDEQIPAAQLFNYTRSRGRDYQLKFGNLNDGVASHYQAVNAKNALWSDQTEVFGSSQQDWKAAKDFWGNTFGYVPVIGNTGNIVFGVHDGLYGMTAEDRVGGSAAAVISSLQLAHELAPGAIESGLGESVKGLGRAENYTWKQNSQTNDFEFVNAPKPPSNTHDITVPSEGASGNRLRPSQAGQISQYAVPDGEQLIEGTAPNAKGIYQVKDAITGTDRWLIRYTDATDISKVYEIHGSFKPSNNYVQIIDRETRLPVKTVHSSGNGEWVSANGNGGVRRWPWERKSSPTPSEDVKSPPAFADQFRDYTNTRMSGSERIDEFLKNNAGTHYDFATSNFEGSAGIPETHFKVLWNIDETGFSVEPSEKAQLTEHSSSEYSPNFVLDINRNPYTVTTRENGLAETLHLAATADSAEGIRQARLSQFEGAIADADLRARISEVAHQGSIAPATIELNGGSVLQDGYYFGADDTRFHIDHDRSSMVTTVQITSRGHLSNPQEDISRVPGVEVIIKRTFTIREGNDLDSLFTIDQNAPTHIETVIAP